MKRLMELALLALFSAGFLSACNTVEGVGEDVQAVGEEIDEAAEDSGANDDDDDGGGG